MSEMNTFNLMWCDSTVVSAYWQWHWRYLFACCWSASSWSRYCCWDDRCFEYSRRTFSSPL